jgi:hypothetical protein
MRTAAMYEAPTIIGTCINCIAPGSLAATLAIIAVGIGLAVKADRRKLVPARNPTSVRLRVQSEIHGPVSSSKCRSNRRMKAASATQIIGKAKHHSILTSGSSKEQSRRASIIA